VEAGGVRYHAIEVKKDGVVVVAADALAIRLPHGSLSFNSTSLMSCTASPLVQQLTGVGKI
jgi:hypothetical protein